MKVLIDTDCGVDDSLALALMARAPDVEVVAVTSTFGNTAPDQAAANASLILAAAGHSETPVFSGAISPVGFEPRLLHGVDGLGGYGASLTGSVAAESGAAEGAIREFCESSSPEDVLLCLGPLTNAARARPTVVRPRVVAVGGAGLRGEVDPGRDPNVGADVEAARWVADHASVDWVTINSGSDVWLTGSDFPASPLGGLLRRVHEDYGWACADRAGRRDWSPSGYDSLAAIAALRPDRFPWRRVRMVWEGGRLWGAGGGEHRMLAAKDASYFRALMSEFTRGMQ